MRIDRLAYLTLPMFSIIGGSRTRGCSGDKGDGRTDGQGGQLGAQGKEVDDGVDRVPDFSTIIAQQLQNLLPTIVAQVGDQACNPKGYNGKGGAIVYTRWMEKMESVHIMSGCKDSQTVKYIVGSFFGKALTWWNSQIHTRGQEATVGEDTSQPPPPIASTEAPQMVSSIKLPILKKGEYILWTMKMEQYLAHTDYALWEVILNGNSAVQMTKYEAGNKVEVPPVTTQKILARTRERKAKSTLLMAIPDEHLARFYGIKDAKTLWAAIKTQSGGNAESKKLQKNVLKQQFENFSVSNSEGLDKGYDRFQRLLSLLEIHRAGVSTEDANQKFLRSLPSAWSNISMIMRNKPGIDNLEINDLFNNLKVYEADFKGSSGSSSNSQNVAFVYAESTSSTNELNAAYSVSTATGHNSQAQGSSSYADELMFLFFANQSSSPQLDNKDIEQIHPDDLEEMDLKWQLVLTKPRLSVLTVTEEGTLPGIAEQPGTQGTGVEMLEMQGTEEEIMRRKQLTLLLWLSLQILQALRAQNLSTNVKTGLGYDSQFNKKEVLAVKEEEVTETVFDNRSSDEENSLANDRFKKGEGYHTVPPPLTGNYMPPKSDLSFAGLDDSIYKFKISETVTSLTKDEKDAPETSTACVEKPKEDRMAKKSVLPNNVGKGTGHKESRPVWNNVQRINHQNKFAQTVVFTRSGRIPVSAAKPKVAASTSAVKPVNIAGPKQSVPFSKSRSIFHKSNSLIRRSFYNATTHSRRNSTERVNTAGSKTVSAFKGNGVTAVKTSAGNQTDKNAGPQDTNRNAGTQDNVDAGNEVSNQYYIVLPLWFPISFTFKSSNDKATDDKPKDNTCSKTVEEPVNKEDQSYRDKLERLMSQEKEAINAASTSGTFSAGGPLSPHPDAFILANTLLHVDQDDSQIPDLEDTAELRSTGIFNNAYDDNLDILTSPVQSMGVEADFNNMDSSSIIEPKKVAQALDDESWDEAMQEELL
nr:ribonuclease H-like domain-containing protein [Tanacetum cinerariifolium]